MAEVRKQSPSVDYRLLLSSCESSTTRTGGLFASSQNDTLPDAARTAAGSAWCPQLVFNRSIGKMIEGPVAINRNACRVRACVKDFFAQRARGSPPRGEACILRSPFLIEALCDHPQPSASLLVISCWLQIWGTTKCGTRIQDKARAPVAGERR